MNFFIKKNEIIANIYYFSAFFHWDEDVTKRHKDYISALKLNNVTPILGKYKKKDKYCKYCRKDRKVPEEKETDVNISLKLFIDAYKDNYDKAFLVSGDTDLVPAVKAIKNEFPKKK